MPPEATANAAASWDATRNLEREGAPRAAQHFPQSLCDAGKAFCRLCSSSRRCQRKDRPAMQSKGHNSCSRLRNTVVGRFPSRGTADLDPSPLAGFEELLWSDQPGLAQRKCVIMCLIVYVSARRLKELMTSFCFIRSLSGICPGSLF